MAQRFSSGRLHGDVRSWHKADIPSCTAHVRFRGQSGHDFLRCECPLMTQSAYWAVSVGSQNSAIVQALPVQIL